MSSLLETFLIGGIIGGGAYLFTLWYDRNDKDSDEIYESPHTPFLNLIRSSLTQKEDNPFDESNIVYEDEFTAEELKELDAGIDADYELKEPDQISEQPPFSSKEIIEEEYELDKFLEDAEAGTEWDKRNQDEDLDDDEEMNVIKETKLKD